VLLLLNPLLSNHWLRLNHDGYPSTRNTAASLAQKQLLNTDTGLWIFVVSNASGRSLLTTHSDRIYTYYTDIYAGQNPHTVIRIRIRRNIIYTSVYIRYVYILIRFGATRTTHMCANRDKQIHTPSLINKAVWDLVPTKLPCHPIFHPRAAQKTDERPHRKNR